jgi:CRP-like cAMP-binding protein
VARRLNSLSPLGAEAQELLRGLEDIQSHPQGVELTPSRLKPRFLISGWAARIRWLADGRRQILSFVLPGDGVGLSLSPNPLALAPAVALTILQTVDADPVLRALDSPAPPVGLREALRMAARMDEALLLDQVVRLGRQTAYERICHLLLEFRDRLADVGLAQEGSFGLPLTQEVLADASGLSIVHVNRILQQLRRERLLDLRGGRAVLLDIDRLTQAAEYRRPQTSSWAAVRTAYDEETAPARPVL